MNDEYRLTGKYYPPGEYEENEGKIPPVHSIESTSKALPVGWVSMKDKLPCGDLDQAGTVDFLVYIELTGDIVVSNYFPKMGLWNMPIGFHDETVTHWMPLPAPPKD